MIYSTNYNLILGSLPIIPNGITSFFSNFHPQFMGWVLRNEIFKLYQLLISLKFANNLSIV